MVASCSSIWARNWTTLASACSAAPRAWSTLARLPESSSRTSGSPACTLWLSPTKTSIAVPATCEATFTSSAFRYALSVSCTKRPCVYQRKNQTPPATNATTTTMPITPRTHGFDNGDGLSGSSRLSEPAGSDFPPPRAASPSFSRWSRDASPSGSRSRLVASSPESLGSAMEVSVIRGQSVPRRLVRRMVPTCSRGANPRMAPARPVEAGRPRAAHPHVFHDLNNTIRFRFNIHERH